MLYACSYSFSKAIFLPSRILGICSMWSIVILSVQGIEANEGMYAFLSYIAVLGKSR